MMLNYMSLNVVTKFAFKLKYNVNSCVHLEGVFPSCFLPIYTLSKISNWSPYIFMLVLKVRFGFIKFMFF